jgi:hypothetical protein
MVKVSGSTNQFIYENNYKIDPILNFGYSNLNGGFIKAIIS